MSVHVFTKDQITALREVERAHTKVGRPGFRVELQALLDLKKQELVALKAGGAGSPQRDDPFLVQSKRLWNLGWGGELGFKRRIDQYRQSLEREGLPVTPIRPTGMPSHLNRLVLWDTRPLQVKVKGGVERISLVKTCRLCGVACGVNDNKLIQHEATPEITVPVRWVWCQDGRMNRNRRPGDCRQAFVRPEVGAEALTGLFLYAHDHTVIGGADGHVMDLPGSVHRAGPSGCAYLRLFADGPGLRWYWGVLADPQDGSASRWE